MENFENREKLVIRTGTYSLEELSKLILGENPYSLKINDERFLPTEKGGVFKYFDYNLAIERDPLTGEIPQKFFPYVKKGETIVALAQLSESMYKKDDEEKVFSISFVSVDPKFQGKGYASKLLEEIFLFAKEHKIILQNSTYTEEGEEKLFNLIQRLREKYPEVDFREDEVFMEGKRRMEEKIRKKNMGSKE